MPGHYNDPDFFEHDVFEDDVFDQRPPGRSGRPASPTSVIPTATPFPSANPYDRWDFGPPVPDVPLVLTASKPPTL